MPVKEILPGIELDPCEKELPIVEVNTLRNQNFAEVIFMGDFHIGSGYFSSKQFEAYRDFILKEPERKVVLMGDLLDLSGLSRWIAQEKQAGYIQAAQLIDLLEPIKDRIIVSVEGNHEKRFYNSTKGTASISDLIFPKLGIKPLMPRLKQRWNNQLVETTIPQKGQMFILRAKKGKEFQDYSVYVIHGTGAAQSQIFTYLKKHYLNNPTFSLLAMGHLHRIATQHRVNRQIRWINGKYYLMMTEQRWLITGSFVKYLPYAEEKGYPLTKIGAPVVRFYVNKNEMEVVDARARYDVGRKDDPLKSFLNTYWQRINRWIEEGKEFDVLLKLKKDSDKAEKKLSKEVIERIEGASNEL